MANDNDSVDSNGNSTDLRPRRSNRAKGKPIQQLEETDENVVVHNNVVYKVGDFVYYLDKKQDIYRIGLIEEFKQQKRDKLVNKRPEISVKQFYRLDEIPSSVLSNHGEYDTHVMPPNFPDWLRQREIFISDNALSTSCSSLRSLCTVRHFPDLNHAMALFSSAQSSSQVTNSSPRVDHHTLITGKDNSCIPIPKQRDDNTFFYVYSYNARGRKLVATYLEIRVGPAYQVELPKLRSIDDQINDSHYAPGAWEQPMWKPNQIPDEVFGVYNMATISIACFSGFGGGVDDNASVENGRKIASHMLTCQKALDCLHKSQYIMEKAMEIFAENSLPETSKMPFLWTDEDHLLFDESVKIHGKNFLRIKQDKRNKKGRLVGDYVTFYYYWKKNRPKNRKFTVKKNLRSRASNAALSELATNEENNDQSQQHTITTLTENNITGRQNEGDNQSPSDASIECCLNCKLPLPKEEEVSLESDKTVLSDRMKALCSKCQHYLRRYGYQKPIEIIEKIKASDDEDEVGDFEEGVNGFDEEDDDEDGEDDEEDDVFQTSNTSPPIIKDHDGDNSNKNGNHSAVSVVSENRNTLAINKYDFDEEDENVEEVSSLLKRNQAKHSLLREPEPKTATTTVKSHTNASNSPNKSLLKSSSSTPCTSQSTKSLLKSSDTQSKSNKRSSLLRKSSSSSITNSKKRKTLDTIKDDTSPITRSSSVTSRNSGLNLSVRNDIHESLKSNISHPRSTQLGSSNNKVASPRDYNTSTSSSTSSSSSSTSNDSSFSSDEGDTIQLPTVKLEIEKESQNESTNKERSDTSYNQMITSIPNIPGVCAVTNVGEPMPLLLTQNLSTDLSMTNSSTSLVSDLKITVAEPLYKQLSNRNSLATTNSSPAVTPSSFDALSSLNKVYKPPIADPAPIQMVPQASMGSINNDAINAKFVNFNAFSNQRTDATNNPEETGLNLVKPKKRNDNWTPVHDSPSKLVHHRADKSVEESSLINHDSTKHDVIHASIFGHVIHVLKSGDGCARTDYQHTTSLLKPSDIENKRAYITKVTASDVSTSTVSQESCKRHEESKKLSSMPPPLPSSDKNIIHHPSIAKNYTIPPLTHSANTSNTQTSISNPAHTRKVNATSSNHGLQSASPGNSSNRPPSSFSSNMIRPNHMHNTSNISSPINNHARNNMHMNPAMQSLANNPLLADYNNMNKVNMNEMFFYQNPAQSYEDLAKYQEMQKIIMMQNLTMPPVHPMQWDQRDRFGSNPVDSWTGNMAGMGGGPIGPDLQAILRAINQTQPSSINNAHTRPRSAIGNPSNNTANMAPGSSSSSGGGITGATSADNKPGSGRASANHEPSLAGDNPEMVFQMLMAYQNLIKLQKPVASNTPAAATNTNHHHQPNNNPPVAHALNNFVLPNNMAIQQSILAQMQAQSSPIPAPKPINPQFAAATNPLQQQTDFLRMYMALNRPGNR